MMESRGGTARFEIVRPGRPSARRWRKLIMCLGSLFFGASHAGAADLENFLSDLYGGDGITLVSTIQDRPFSNNFEQSSLDSLADLNSAVASGLGFFSLNSGVAGYTFDLELGVPVRTTESLGPLIAERAETLGAQKLSLAFTYTRLDFKRFGGDRLSDISIIVKSADVSGEGVLGIPNGFLFEKETIRIDLDVGIEQDIFALFASYGMTENWDVGVVVPILRNEVRVEAEATINRNPDNLDQSNALHNFLGPGEMPPGDVEHSSIDRSASGIGDMLLRTKYNFLLGKEQWPDLAFRGQIKLPTGREADLLGTGHTNFEVMLIASRQLGRLAPHLNVSYELTTGPSELDNLRYVIGFDARLHQRLTLALETTGRFAPNADFGEHLVDFAIGGKWNAYRSLLFDVNFQIPLNRDEGLRPDFIWSVGLEYPF